MKFLYNAWYCGGISSDLKAGAINALTILNQPILFYRKTDSTIVALHDRCPHRFAPLSKGTLCDDQIQCPYHGLRFDASGQCSHNPHGDGRIPTAARVDSYPVIEKYGVYWIWMGDRDKADQSLLPDFTDVTERPGWRTVHGQLHVRANYQLVVDNLLDLSHVQFLHAALASNKPPPAEFRPVISLEQKHNTVIAINEFEYTPISDFYRLLWEKVDPPDLVDMRGNMRWDIPSLLLLDTGSKPLGSPREEGPSAPSAHLLTPETETTTHYFWIVARDTHLDSDDVSDKLTAAVDNAFRYEDEPMIEACQQRMQTTDLMSLNPVLLPTDGPAVRARRILTKAIEIERQP